MVNLVRNISEYVEDKFIEVAETVINGIEEVVELALQYVARAQGTERDYEFSFEEASADLMDYITNCFSADTTEI